MSSPELSLSSLPGLILCPMDPARDGEVYRAARREAWLLVHPDLVSFDGPGFLEEAAEQQLWDRRALWCARLDDRTVGILQLATLRSVREGAGHISFLWVREALRRCGLGSRLLELAAAVYLSMGRTFLRLNCSPANHAALSFYLSRGFSLAGRVPGAEGELDLLEKKI